MGWQSWPSAWPPGLKIVQHDPLVRPLSCGVLLEGKEGSVWSLLPGAGLKSAEPYHLTAGPTF